MAEAEKAEEPPEEAGGRTRTFAKVRVHSPTRFRASGTIFLTMEAPHARRASGTHGGSWATIVARQGTRGAAEVADAMETFTTPVVSVPPPPPAQVEDPDNAGQMPMIMI